MLSSMDVLHALHKEKVRRSCHCAAARQKQQGPQKTQGLSTLCQKVA